MNYLVLINTKYPFRTGETFLESEMRETATEFDRIIIFPTDTLVTEKQTRKLPADNIETVLFEEKNFNVTKGSAAAKAVLSMMKYPERTMKLRFYESYFEQHSMDQAKRIMSKLDGIDFKKDDRVILYSYWFYTGARICVALKAYLEERVGKVTLVSRAHRFDVYEFANDKSYLPRREFLLENLDRVYVCSEDGEKYMRSKYPKYQNKICTSRLGTYDHGYREVKSRMPFEIVTCSRVTEIKRLSSIVDALSILEERSFDFKWTHMGDGPLFEEVKEYAAAKLNSDRYEFLGRKPNKEVYDYYNTHDVNLFLNVSTSEGLPVSIMEAISFGIPVVATDVGGTSEIILDQKNGFLLDMDFETDTLVSRISAVMTMPEDDYQALCGASRSIWEDWFDAKKNYAEFAGNIKSI